MSILRHSAPAGVASAPQGEKESRVTEEGYAVSAGLCALPADSMGTRTCHQVLLLQPHHSQVCWVPGHTSTPWVCWGQNPPLGRPLIQWLVALPQVPAPSCCRCTGEVLGDISSGVGPCGSCGGVWRLLELCPPPTSHSVLSSPSWHNAEDPDQSAPCHCCDTGCPAVDTLRGDVPGEWGVPCYFGVLGGLLDLDCPALDISSHSIPRRGDTPLGDSWTSAGAEGEGAMVQR